MKHKITLQPLDDLKLELNLTLDELESLELKLTGWVQELYQYRKTITKLEEGLGNA